MSEGFNFDLAVKNCGTYVFLRDYRVNSRRRKGTRPRRFRNLYICSGRRRIPMSRRRARFVKLPFRDTNSSTFCNRGNFRNLRNVNTRASGRADRNDDISRNISC